MIMPEFTIPVTESLRAALTLAEDEAARRHSAFLDVEHLALGALSHPGGAARAMCESNGVNVQAVYDRIAAQVGIERSAPVKPKGMSRVAKLVLERAVSEARSLGHGAVTDGHLLLALLCERDGIVHDAFAATPLTEYGARVYLRDRLPASERGGGARPGPGRPLAGGASYHPSLLDRARALLGIGRKSTVDKRPNRRGRPVIVVDPNQPRTARPAAAGSSRLPMIIGIVLAIIALMVAFLPPETVFTFVFVFVGWIFSVTLHEFGHALVAYWGGDYTVKDKGYLSFNPLKYTHPMLSIAMPLIFLVLGGIGLPGGAVYIERHRLKNQWWGAAVSAAGPAANLLFAILLALPFAVGLVDVNTVRDNLVFALNRNYFMDRAPGLTEDQVRVRLGIEDSNSIWDNEMIWSAVALLAMLQISAVVLNLLPIPPLDGSGIIEPFLDPQTRYQYMQLARYGLLIVFILFWYVDPINNAFWNLVFDITKALGVPPNVANAALIERFLFWRN